MTNYPHQTATTNIWSRQAQYGHPVRRSPRFGSRVHCRRVQPTLHRHDGITGYEVTAGIAKIAMVIMFNNAGVSSSSGGRTDTFRDGEPSYASSTLGLEKD